MTGAPTGYLLDTSIISALAPGREAYLPAGMADWLHRHDARLFIPCIAVAELAQGIAKLRRSGALARADALEAWLQVLLTSHADHILPLASGTSLLAGQMADAAVASGCHPGFPDVAIAAIARHHGLLLLTANLRHFEPLGVACLNPLAALPVD
ncbi:MAG: PIN domain-containing protein [Burkholderiales bacterium]|nr:PIN domain-containing protein [Burkholderiales bacterium]